eukprot:CAMPEP_0119325566 /NCGR_PEP_ID=MMETSP1333-20130426/66142_1 /TAXON_ID=418940 /ORGANISM="Scyphosphaera apsteinii, Strain RCC1455" /LENGTH=84 /DNA_ID=CAMNT_0007333591 /DNA_START=631 /DNA_END=882 /DNA_ORIENTATION=-
MEALAAARVTCTSCRVLRRLQMSSPLLGVRLLLLDAASVDEHDAFDAGVAGAGRRAKLMPRSELASEKVWATTSPSEVQLAVAD